MVSQYPIVDKTLGAFATGTPDIAMNRADAAATSPDAEVKVYGVALDTNTPPALLQNESSENLNRMQAGSIDYDTLQRENPAMAKLYDDVHAARIVQDEHAELMDTSYLATQMRGAERMGRFLGALPAGAESGAVRFMLINNRKEQEKLVSEYGDLQKVKSGELDFEEFRLKHTPDYSLSGIKTASGPTTPEEWEADVTTRFQRNGQRIQQLAGRKPVFEQPKAYGDVANAKRYGEAVQNVTAETVGYSLAEALTQDPITTGISTALAPIGGPLALGARAGAQAKSIFDLNYQLEMLDNQAKSGIDPTNAQAVYDFYQSQTFKSGAEAATAKGAVDSGINTVATVLSAFTRVPTALTLGTLSGPSGEYFGELAAGREPKPGDVVLEAIGDLPFTALEAYNAATANAGKETIDVKAYTALVARTQKLMGKAASSMDFGAAIDEFTSAFSNLKTLQRDPTVAQKFAEDLTDQGAPKDLFLDPQALQQANVDIQELAKLSPTFAARVGEAVASGGTVQVPFSEYVTLIAPTMGNKLNDHVRAEPDGFSRAEAEEFMQTQAELVKTEAANIAAEAKLSEPFEASTAAVEENIFSQLKTTGRFTDTVNRFYAKLTASAFTVNGAKLGLTAEQFYNEFGGINIVADTDASPAVFTQTYKGMQLEQDGRLKVTHFSATSGITQLDPNQWGMTGAALPRSERNRQGLVPNRAYGYLGSDFKKENQLGDVRYTGYIDPSRYYDLESDPLSLRQRGAAISNERGFNDVVAGIELAVQEAGFDGYIAKAPQGGFAVVSYKPIDVTEGDAPAEVGGVTQRRAEVEDFTAEGIKDILNRTDWTILTPENPNAVKLSDEENTVRHERFKEYLQQNMFSAIPVKGQYGAPENSYIITNITEAQARAIGLAFEQESVLTNRGLVYQDGTANPAIGVTVFDTRPEDYYTELPDGTFFSVNIDFDKREGSVYNQLADDTQGQVEGFAGGLFYSNMYRVFSQKLNKTGTPAQFRQQIASFIKGGLIKQAEYDWSGLPEWLDYTEREINDRSEQKVYGFINEAGQFEARSTKQSEQNPIERTITPSSKIELSSLLSGLRAGYFELDETVLSADSMDNLPTIDDVQFYGGEGVSRYDDAQRAEEISIRFNEEYDRLQEDGPDIMANGNVTPYTRRLFMLDENDQPYKDENGKWVLDEIEVRKDAEDIVTDSDIGVYEETIDIAGDEWKLRWDVELARIELFDPEGDSVFEKGVSGANASRMGERAREMAQDYFLENGILAYDEGKGDTRFMEYIEPGEKTEYKEFLINLPGVNDVGVSQHFDDTPSVLMHIRATGRTDIKNRKVLFIEEIQSDWHQQGYKRGYKSKQEGRSKQNIQTEIDALLNTMRERIGTYLISDEQWAANPDLNTRFEELEAEHRAAKDSKAVADAPLIKEWPTVALKRMIGYAVENGYEGVAWTTGDMQKSRYPSAPADRYDTELPSLAAKLLKKYDAKTEMLDVRLDSPEDVPGFYINDRLKEAITSATDGAFSLFQKTEAQPRGTFNPKTNTIALLKAANLSTFIHESGHLFLEMLAFSAAHPNAQADIKADMDAALKWMGVSDITGNRMEVWNTLTLEQKRPFHEKWARGFEAYLFEGKSPAARLADVFRRMKAWLIRTYKDITNLNVELDPEIRGVFDRMVASADQIKEAQNMRAYEALFDDQAESGMADAEFRVYEALQTTSTQEALEELQRRSLRDMQWMTNAKSREMKKLQKRNAAKRREVREEVRAELMTQPAYQAIKFFKTGQYEAPVGASKEVRDAYLETSVQNHKLSLPVLKESYGEEGNALWRFLQGGKYGFVAQEGMHPDVAATMFGYDSGDAMIRDILATPDFNDTLEGMTDQRMLEQYGDLIDERAMGRAAEKAIHNEARAKVIATEMNALQKAAGKTRIMASMAKAYADDAIGKLLVREVRPGQYTRQEAKAARESAEAFRKGDIETAAVKKRAQLLQNYSAKAAFDALDDVEKAVRYFKKFGKASIAKKISPEYVDQIHQLLDRYELTTTTLKALDKRKSLREFVERQQELGIEPNIPPEVMDEVSRKNYREATVDELRGLYDTIKQIEHLGRLKNKLLTAKDQRDFDTTIEQIVTNIRAKGPKRTLDNTTRASNWEATKINFKGYLAMHRKVGSIGRQLDGFQDGGIFWDTFIRTMNDAGAKEAKMREETTEKMLAIIQPLLSSRPFADAFGSKKEFFPTVGRSLNREERMAIALNVGNAGNLQRLLDGEGWEAQQITPILDSLSKEEWDAIQSIWDLFESFRPQIAAKEKRVYGVEPKWVEPTPVMTPHGEYRGGYYPIKYDGRRNDKAAAFNEAEEAKAMLKGAFLSATTRRSFTKTRSDEVKGRPLLYTMDGLYSGLNDVIHDLTWHEWVIDMNRMLRDGRVSSAVRDIYGDPILKQIKSAVRDIAGGDAMPADPFERVLADLRAGATVAGLGFNLVNSLINVTGMTQSISRIGARWMLVGLREMSTRPRGLVEEVHARSDLMRTRMRTRGREINEIQSRIRGKSTAREKVDNLMFAPMYLTQMMVDTPTWWGAYQKSLLEFGDEAKAAALADQAVLDAQSGGQVKDLAAIRRGNAYMKLFTTFYGYFSGTYNLAVEKTKKTDFSSPADIVRLGGDYLLLAVVPAVLTTLIKTAINGDDEDWELDKLAKKAAAESAGFALGTLVGVREFGGVVQMLAGTNYGTSGYGGPAGLRFFGEIYKLANQVSQGEADTALMKAFINVLGVVFKLPAAQINRTLTGTNALIEGETDNPLAIIGGPPPK